MEIAVNNEVNEEIVATGKVEVITSTVLPPPS